MSHAWDMCYFGHLSGSFCGHARPPLVTRVFQLVVVLILSSGDFDRGAQCDQVEYRPADFNVDQMCYRGGWIGHAAYERGIFARIPAILKMSTPYSFEYVAEYM